jgi:hypothetical protein
MLTTHNAIYLHNPKTAGTWLRYVLEPVTVDWLEHHVPEQPFSHTNTFSFVRNPWSWYVSLYLFLRNGSEKFAKTYPIKPPILQALSGSKDFADFIQAATYPTPEFKQKVYSIYRVLKQIKPFEEPYLQQQRDPEGVILTKWIEEDVSYYAVMCDVYTRYAHTIGKYETVKADLLEMTKTCGDLTDEVLYRIENTEPINVTANKDSYQTYYNDVTMKMVADTSAELIDQYGYTFK